MGWLVLRVSKYMYWQRGFGASRGSFEEAG